MQLSKNGLGTLSAPELVGPLRRNARSNRDELHSAFLGKQILSFFFPIQTSGCMIPVHHVNPHRTANLLRNLKMTNYLRPLAGV